MAPLTVYRLQRIWRDDHGYDHAARPEYFDGPDGQTLARAAAEHWLTVAQWARGGWQRRSIELAKQTSWSDNDGTWKRWEPVEVWSQDSSELPQQTSIPLVG